MNFVNVCKYNATSNNYHFILVPGNSDWAANTIHALNKRNNT